MQTATEAPASFRSSALRPGPLGLIREAVAEILRRRRLIRHLMDADIKRKGADTILGNLWWVLDPVIQMGAYLILLTVIFQRSTPDFPLFLFAAILPWKWFASSISGAVGTVVRQERLIKQVQFPKIVLPVSALIAEILNFAFGVLLLLAVLFVAFPAHATINVVWLPVIAFVQFVFTLGLALIVSAVNVFYRDVGILMGHLIRLWFFLSPTLWSFDSTVGRFQGIADALGEVGLTLLQYNPFAILLTAYRDVVYGRVDQAGTGFTPGQAPDLEPLGMLFLVSLGMVLLGTIIFKRLEPAFAKVL
ncbi:MAG: ABC transporter permease [Chloroflexota bacterium]|nr:ABC transporter permease [Chloroflexota bacterium]